MSNGKCYWCAAPATSREHVPPKCIFPELGDTVDGRNHREQLITVPACELHNVAKSHDDEYLLYILAINILNNSVGHAQAATKVLRAFKRASGLAQRVLGTTRSILVEEIGTGKVEQTVAVKIDDARLSNALEHIARAIYFHHFGKRWIARVRTFPEFLMLLDLPSALERNERFEALRHSANELFASSERHGANQDVFFYQVLEDPNDSSQIIMRTSFYGSTRALMLFTLEEPEAQSTWGQPIIPPDVAR